MRSISRSFGGISGGGGGGGGTIGGSIADTQVAFGTAVNTIGGDANFTWDTTLKKLQVTALSTTNPMEWLSAGTVRLLVSPNAILPTSGDAWYWALKPGNREYRVGTFDAGGSLIFARSDANTGVTYTCNATVITMSVTPANTGPVLYLLGRASSGLVLTPFEGGGLGILQIGRRMSDSSAAVGSSTEFWPYTGQTAPVIAVVVPGGGTSTFTVDASGKVTVPAAGLTIGASLVTLAGAFTTSGAFASTFTMTGTTGVTFPTAGTLAILGANTFTGSQTLRAGATGAGTAPLKFTSGTNMTTAEAGAAEYNGTNLFFTRAGTVRENVLVAIDNVAAPGTTAGALTVNFYGSAATNYLGDPNRWLSVNVLGVTYKIPLYT